MTPIERTWEREDILALQDHNLKPNGDHRQPVHDYTTYYNYQLTNPILLRNVLVLVCYVFYSLIIYLSETSTVEGFRILM